MLSGALAGQKKFQEAEPLLVEGYSGLKARAAQIPPAAQPRLAEAVRRLVDLYTAWEKPEEAAKWQAVLEQSTEKQDSSPARPIAPCCRLTRVAETCRTGGHPCRPGRGRCKTSR